MCGVALYRNIDHHESLVAGNIGPDVIGLVALLDNIVPMASAVTLAATSVTLAVTLNGALPKPRSHTLGSSYSCGFCLLSLQWRQVCD